MVTSALTVATAALGGAGTTPPSAWYHSLDKPAWQPPGAAFPLVWTPLYGLIAWGTRRTVARAPEAERLRLLAPYAAWTGFATALNASIWWRNR